jgi:uncharacterized LabA/DUF88 family protein
MKILLSKTKKVMVAIDAANLNIGLRRYGKAADIKKLKQHVVKKVLSAAFYYYAPSFSKDSRHQKFLSFLKYQGFVLRTKPVKVIRTEDGSHRKANFDVEIAIDVVDNQRKFDTLLLFSGDSDFVALINYLHKRGKKAIVLSTRRNVATELLKSADEFIDLLKMKTILRPYKTPRPRKAGSGNQ